MDNQNTQLFPSPISSKLKLPSAAKLLGEAISFYLKNWRVLTGIASFPFILSILEVFSGDFSIFPLLAGTVVFFLASMALLLAVIEQGKPAGGVMSAYQRGAKLFVPFVWVNGLAVLAIIGGFFALVVPGILLSVWLSLAVYVLFAENKRGTSALIASWHYTTGYWRPVFWRFLFFGLIFFAVWIVFYAITMGPAFYFSLLSGSQTPPDLSPLAKVLEAFLENLIILPLSTIFSYLIYRNLKEIKASVQLEKTEESKLRKRVAIFNIIGVVGSVGLIILSVLFLGIFALTKLPSF